MFANKRAIFFNALAIATLDKHSRLLSQKLSSGELALLAKKGLVGRSFSADDRNTLAVSTVRVVVPNRVMLCATIIPKRQCLRFPLDLTPQAWCGVYVFIQQIKDSLALFPAQTSNI